MWEIEKRVSLDVGLAAPFCRWEKCFVVSFFFFSLLQKTFRARGKERIRLIWGKRGEMEYVGNSLGVFDSPREDFSF